VAHAKRIPAATNSRRGNSRLALEQAPRRDHGDGKSPSPGVSRAVLCFTLYRRRWHPIASWQRENAPSLQAYNENGSMALSESEWKMLALKAKNFSTNLYGVKNIKFFMVDGSKLAWHKNAMDILMKAPVVAENTLASPYSKMDAMQWVAKKIGLKPGAVANILFEDVVLISFQLDDLEEFILCVFKLNATCDFSLFLFEPDAAMVIHESGAGLAFSKATRAVGMM
jgi:hypothetical protein